MKHFMLNPECYFTKGAVRGAIYNLHTRNVFATGPELTALYPRAKQIESLLMKPLKHKDTDKQGYEDT